MIMIYFPTIYTLRNNLLAIIFSLIFANILNAQSFDITSMIFQDQEIEYMGQLDWQQKNKNGSGIYKDGKNVYFGDFFNDKKNGYGMIIAGQKGKIKNLKGCMVYIGSWFDGKKEGKGTCYDFNGDIIYHGKFENDKPTSIYPSTNTSTSRFSFLGLDGGAYLGELTDGVPNGYGLFIANDGELSFGKVKDGQRYGTSLLLENPYVWKVVKWEGDSFSEVTNSNEHNSKLQVYKDAHDKWWSELKSEFKEVGLGLLSTTNQFVEYKSSQNSSSSASYSSGNSSRNSSSSKSNRSSVSSSKTSQDCGTAWQTDSKNYSNLETRAMNCIDESEYNSIQSKMKSIRQKWVSRGCHITQSEWETKPFKDKF